MNATDDALTRPTVLTAAQIMEQYLVGSGDWTWAEELDDLLTHDRDRFRTIQASIRADGVREPILLGDDQRVWDGHHRILASHEIDPQTPLRVEYGHSD